MFHLLGRWDGSCCCGGGTRVLGGTRPGGQSSGWGASSCGVELMRRCRIFSGYGVLVFLYFFSKVPDVQLLFSPWTVSSGLARSEVFCVCFTPGCPKVLAGSSAETPNNEVFLLLLYASWRVLETSGPSSIWISGGWVTLSQPHMSLSRPRWGNGFFHSPLYSPCLTCRGSRTFYLTRQFGMKKCSFIHYTLSQRTFTPYTSGALTSYTRYKE